MGYLYISERTVNDISAVYGISDFCEENRKQELRFFFLDKVYQIKPKKPKFKKLFVSERQVLDISEVYGVEAFVSTLNASGVLLRHISWQDTENKQCLGGLTNC